MFVDFIVFREGASPLEKATPNSAGYDIRAWLPEELRECGAYIEKNRTRLIKTGIALNIPVGMELQIRPRSGLALKHHITVLNSPGTVDSDYCPDCPENLEKFELGVILHNHGVDGYTVNHGDRIAQGVFCALPAVELIEADENVFPYKTENQRKGGFGSTGNK